MGEEAGCPCESVGAGGRSDHAGEFLQINCHLLLCVKGYLHMAVVRHHSSGCVMLLDCAWPTHKAFTSISGGDSSSRPLLPLFCPSTWPLQPVRDHFENNPEAKALLKQVKSFKVSK